VISYGDEKQARFCFLMHSPGKMALSEWLSKAVSTIWMVSGSGGGIIDNWTTSAPSEIIVRKDHVALAI
jgi:hypothetical protein